MIYFSSKTDLIRILNGPVSMYSISAAEPVDGLPWSWNEVSPADIDQMFVCLEYSLTAVHFQNGFAVIADRGEQFQLSMAIENVVFMHECSPEHLRMGTVRLQ